MNKGKECPRHRRNVREQVAGFANADVGALFLGIEDDHRITDHRSSRCNA